jgi:hypothetical protein
VAAATAATVTVPPIAKTLLPPARSPLTFSKIKSGQGFSQGISAGTPLRRGQTIQIVVAKGKDIPAPRDCSCQGLGLRQPRGQTLASVYVRVKNSSGRVIAVAPASGLFIEGNGNGGLPVGFTYSFAKGRRSFPAGSQLIVYGFFTTR